MEHSHFNSINYTTFLKWHVIISVVTKICIFQQCHDGEVREAPLSKILESAAKMLCSHKM